MRKSDRGSAPINGGAKPAVRLYPTIDVLETFGRGRKDYHPYWACWIGLAGALAWMMIRP